jgi:hydroxymethylpyrimidine pyrophosphatase-like HAD family hydrolase
MSNATKKVKDLAYDITFTNDDDGFARWVMSNI